MNISKLNKCPNCKTSFIGEDMFTTFSNKAKDKNNEFWYGKTEKEIWEIIKEFYTPPYNWDKKIAVEMGFDRVEYYLCPDCGHKMYPAFSKQDKTNSLKIEVAK